MTLVPAGSWQQDFEGWQAAARTRLELYGGSPGQAVAAEARDRALGQAVYFFGALALLGGLTWLARADAPPLACALGLAGYLGWLLAPTLLHRRERGARYT